MFFAKGEIIMNNIYKVIWSKAKNCYVVASEIARSHTKSATGSEKIGGVTRRSLLASLMALSLLCGGLGVASAADVVHVDESATGAAEVYTKTGVDTLLADYGRKTEVETNKNNIVNLQTTTTDQGQKIATNTTDIANNKVAINTLDGKLSNLTTTVNGKADAANVYTRTEADAKLDLKANATDVYTKADVNTELAKKADVTALDGKADKADVYSKTDADTTFATKTELNAKADTTALVEYAKTADVNNALNAKANKTDLDIANGKITDLQAKTANLSADGKELTGMTTVSGAKVSGDNVEAGALKVTGAISDGAGVTTTLVDIKASMTQTETNKGDIADLKSKTDTQQTWIGRLKDKTTQISYDPAKGTTVNGVEFKDAEVDANGKGLTGVTTLNTTGDATVGGELNATGKVSGNGLDAKTGAITGGSLSVTGAVNGSSVDAGSGEIKTTGAVKAGTLNTTGDATVGGDLNATGKVSGKGLDAGTEAITGGSLSVTGAVNGSSVNAGSGEIKTTGVVNAGILNTTGNATVGGELNATGKVSGNGLDARTGDIKGGSLSVTGAVNGSSVNADTLNTTGDATVGGDLSAKNTEINGTLHATGATTLDGALTAKGEAAFEKNVTMDQKLTVTGDTSLNKTDVNGALTAKGDVILGTNTAQTVTVNGIADFNAAVKMNNGLNVTNGETNLKNTTVDGDLKVTGTITTNKMVFGDKPTNYTEIDHGKVTSKNLEVNGAGQAISSSSIFNAEENKVGFANNATGDQSFHKQTSDIIMDNVKDRDNSNYRTQTKTETKDIITDKDGNSSTTSQTARENKTYLKDKDGKNTNSTIDTAKGYDKTIKGENGETSTKQDELNITNTAQKGTIKNDAMNIENNANGDMTNTVGGKLTTTVTGQATENFNGGLDTNVTGKENHTVTGDQNIHVTGKQTNEIGGDQVNIIGGNQTTTVTGDISNKAENITNEANTKLTDKVDDNTRVLDSEGITDTVPGADGKGSTFKQRIDAIMGNVKTDAGESEVTQKGDEITSKVGLGEATNSRVTQKKDLLEAAVTDGTNYNISNDTANESAKELRGGTKVNRQYDNLNGSQKTITNGTYTTSKLQTALDITNTAKDGTITNDAKDIVNNASGNMTNTVGGDLTTTVAGNELQEVTGNKTENVTGKVTENYGNGQETNVTGDQYLHVTGKQTNKIDGNQENTIGGNQTTTVTGDISNKAENITNEANTKLTDKVGDHTRVLDSEGITDTVGGSTFKQRIDKIMMESKDVSIKAEETLTNEAKVITNKASEVINNEAVNINNTATGIITSKASEIKNQADKLISNKVGENTWENMENGKITTSIKDGAKQNLTQSNAAGTTQSTVDVGKSTVTIQNADGLVDVVTHGTNTSVQNQTASQIAAAVKDGAGNENASVANATTSANTIKSGSKANTVISTADGTSFINSEAAAPVTGASGAGTAVNTTIKGNTITTGKVTMDYADVMKDLGVYGNANIAGTTTTKTLNVTENATVGGTLDVTKKATFHNDVRIDQNLSVGEAVTAKSYKVGDKTYIDANGIHANNQKITDVADGSISEGSKDAVNGGQLYGVKRDLEHQVDKVGANAAAMANLRPMEFDPSSKWNIAAAIGNYGSETAAALGAFYRPNDDVMVNLSTAFGTGENMVGGGVSVRLGKSGNKLSREENNALKAQVDDLTARMDALLSVLNPNMSKDFPDVPENHWAYEAVSRLAGNDIVQGYPDGEFHGERTMTRYEMAEIIYNALSRGAEAEKELVEEFKPELQAMAASEKATAEKAEG